MFDWLQRIDGMPLMEIGSPEILGIRDKAFEQRRRRFANYVLSVLSLLFAWGWLRGWLAANPAAGVPKIRRPKDTPRANRPWTVPEFVTVVRAAPAELQPPIVLGLFLREGDVLRRALVSL